MEIINLTNDNLRYFRLIYDKSYESCIYSKDDTVFKIYNSGYNRIGYANYDKETLDNKIEKIIILNHMELDETILSPVDFVYVNKEFKGYTMKYIEGKQLSEYLDSDIDTKLNLLSQIKTIISELHSKGIIIFDISISNFIVKEENGNLIVYLCDIDNCCIGNLKYDCISSIAYRYLKCHPLNQNLDIYEFNVLTIGLLSGVNPDLIFNKFMMEDTIFSENNIFYKYYQELLNYKNEDYEPTVILDELINQKKYIR